MICNIEDKRAAKRAKEGRRVAASASRLVEGGKVSGWKQGINQVAGPTPTASTNTYKPSPTHKQLDALCPIPP